MKYEEKLINWEKLLGFILVVGLIGTGVVVAGTIIGVALELSLGVGAASFMFFFLLLGLLR